jgi:hypothetical protein
MNQRSWGLSSLLIIGWLVCGQSANHSQQPRPSGPDKHSGEETAVRLERQAWEALKAKDATTYERLLAEDFVNVGPDGITTKSEEKNLPDQLTLDDYKWDGLRVVHFTPDVTLVAYKATQKAMVRGQPVPTPTWISSLWIKRNEKWLNVFYQETKVE